MIPENETQPKPASKWRFWLGILLSAASLLWLILTTDWPTVWQTLQETNYLLVLAAMATNVLAIFIRARRWQLMFPPANRPRFPRLTVAMLIGQALNLVLPARIGDLVRASLIDTHRTAFVIGTQVTQITLDFLMLGSVVITLLFQVSLPDWWRGSGEAVLLTVLVALIGAVLAIVLRRQILNLIDWLDDRWDSSRRHRLLNIARDLLRSLDQIAQPLVLVQAVSLSVLLWVVYATVNLLLLGAVGVEMSWLVAFFVLAVLQLGSAVPSSPGRVGVFHYLGVQALAIFGNEGSTAVSYAILLHLVSILLPIIIGTALASQMGLTLNTPLRSEQQNAVHH